MPYNPAGLYSLVASYLATPGAEIRTEQHNPVFEDMASALSNVLVRDGRAPMTGTLNMNGQAITNVAVGNSPGSVATLAQAMPIGAVIDFAGTSAPGGWVFCYGQDLNRTTYAALFTIIGTTYGTADSSTFKVPDLRGRVCLAADVSSGRFPGAAVGSSGGVAGASQALSRSSLPNVTLGVNAFGSFSGQTENIPSGTLNSFLLDSGATGLVAFANGSQTNRPYSVTGAITVSGGTESLSGGVAQTQLNTAMPYLTMNKIIKASYDV